MKMTSVRRLIVFTLILSTLLMPMPSYAITAIAKPTITVVSASYNSIKITWNAIPGASGYEVYYGKSSSGTFTKIYKATSGSTVSYTKKALTTGKNYYIKVRAYRLDGSKKNYGKFSEIKVSKPIPAKPTIQVISSSQSSIKVTWNTIAGASGYEVYRSEYASGTFSKIFSATSGSTFKYLDTHLNSANKNYYKVRAYRKVGSKKVYGKFSTVSGIGTSTLPAPDNFSASTYNYHSVQLYYNVVQNAVKYRIYYSKTPSDNINEYAFLDWSSKDCRVRGLDAGTTYYFRVAAVDNNNNVGIVTGFLASKTSDSPGNPPQPKFVLSSIDVIGTKYRMNFSRSTSPIYPIINEPIFSFYIGNSSANMALETTCDLTQYFYYDVTPGQSFWYGFTAKYGKYISTMQKFNIAALGKPTSVVANGINLGGKVNMSWAAVYAASKYNIYYCVTGPYPSQSWLDFKESAGANLHYLTNTTGTSVVLNGIPLGLQYTFIVVPLSSTGVEGWHCGFANTGVIY